MLAVAACERAQAEPPIPTAITITGNRHIDAAMIRSHLHAGPGGRLDATTLDDALKSLYATGLFQNVKISRDGDHVLVTVVENPTIARMAFEGNKKIKDDDLKKALQSKEGGPRAPSSTTTSSASSSSTTSTVISRCESSRRQ